MCIPLSRTWSPFALFAGLAACGGDALTLPSAGGPAAITAVAGNTQQGTVGSELEDPLVVQVTDAASNPLNGVSIAFRFQNPPSGASIQPAEALTGPDGRASARVRLGESAGAHTVEAQVAGTAASSLRATFDLTALAEDDEDRDGKKDRGGRGGRGGHGDGDNDDDDDDD